MIIIMIIIVVAVGGGVVVVVVVGSNGKIVGRNKLQQVIINKYQILDFYLFFYLNKLYY